MPGYTIIILTVLAIAVIMLYLHFSHVLSYTVLKKRILRRQKWDVNICCGKTDGRGINVDLINHCDLPNFILVKDIYNLPFKDKQFETVLSSHTIEHVDDPEKFFKELERIGNRVVLILPPLWDITAALNFFEHKHIFLTLRKEHSELPRFKKLPLASFIQRKCGQRYRA